MSSSDETALPDGAIESLAGRVGSILAGDHEGRGVRVGIACARFNGGITWRLLEGALAAFDECGVDRGDVRVAWVPGAFELPVVARTLAGGTPGGAPAAGAGVPPGGGRPAGGSSGGGVAAAGGRPAGSVDAVICLGAVVRGDTGHYDFVAGQCAAGIQRVQLDTGVPVVFGVLTTDTVAQALERSAPDRSNKGREAAVTAIEMHRLLRSLAI